MRSPWRVYWDALRTVAEAEAAKRREAALAAAAAAAECCESDEEIDSEESE